MDTLDYLINQFNLDKNAPSPIAIPNVGRNDLAKWIHELNFKTGVEVGVSAGEYSEVLCQANPQMKLYGVDPWKPYRGYKDYTRPATFAKLRQEALDRLNQYPQYAFIPDFSLNAVSRFEDKSLDFVYIDANHREPYITQDITYWSKKVRQGGIVAGHDYIKAQQEHYDVISAVNTYVKKHHIKPWFVLGLQAKIPGITRDASRSWMFIRS